MEPAVTRCSVWLNRACIHRRDSSNASRVIDAADDSPAPAPTQASSSASIASSPTSDWDHCAGAGPSGSRDDDRQRATRSRVVACSVSASRGAAKGSAQVLRHAMRLHLTASDVHR